MFRSKHLLFTLLVLAEGLFHSVIGAEGASVGFQPCFAVAQTGFLVRAKKLREPRDYWKGLSSSQKDDIHFIVRTLAYESTISIAKLKSEIERRGERVEDVHPLWFCECIFANEESKCAAASLKTQGGFFWNKFVGGIVRSFTEEAAQNNVKLEYVQDFAKRLNLSPDSLWNLLQQGKFKEFVNYLIDNIPRKSNPNRLNM